MTRFTKVLLLFIAISFSQQTFAQDIHFSQFYMAPLDLNPAMTGVNNCKTRFIVNYRNQWASALGSNAYNTFGASFDQKKAIGREDYIGYGGSLWADVAGASRFGTRKAKFSFSYSKKMAGYRKKASYLVFGVDGALTQRSIDEADLRWPSQIDPDKGFDPSINPNENITDYNFMYPDIAAGLLWFSVLDEKTNWYLGAAIHHLNRPSVTFYEDSKASLYNKYTVHAGAQLPVSKKISVLPFGLFLKQGPHQEINVGASARFVMGPTRYSNQSWQAGLYYRSGTQATVGSDGSQSTSFHSDAVIMSTRFNYEQFSFGLSYDMTVSDFAKAASANGAFELSVKYEICGPESRGVYCPHF